jgi:hypothetical protein
MRWFLLIDTVDLGVMIVVMDKKLYYLFLDDIRIPKSVTWVNLPLVPWEIVRNYDQFVSKIKNCGMPKFIAFDHDLSTEHYHPSMYSDNSEDYNKLYDSDFFKEKTGYHCAKWAVEYCMKNSLTFPDYVCHSMNPIGKTNIESYIENFKRAYTLL